MNQSVSALIVDDHQLYRDGLSSLLEKNSFVKQVFQAENGRVLKNIFLNIFSHLYHQYEYFLFYRRQIPVCKKVASRH